MPDGVSRSAIRCEGLAIVLVGVASMAVLGATIPNVATACKVRLIAAVGIRVFTVLCA